MRRQQQHQSQVGGEIAGALGVAWGHAEAEGYTNPQGVANMLVGESTRAWPGCGGSKQADRTRAVATLEEEVDQWHADRGHRVFWSVKRVVSTVAYLVPAWSTVSTPLLTALEVNRRPAGPVRVPEVRSVAGRPGEAAART